MSVFSLCLTHCFYVIFPAVHDHDLVPGHVLIRRDVVIAAAEAVVAGELLLCQIELTENQSEICYRVFIGSMYTAWMLPS